jgi:hypothetical protein
VINTKNRKVALLFGTIGVAIGIVATITFANLYPTSGISSILSAPDCTRANGCMIVPINGSRNELRGESYKAYEPCLQNREKCTWVTVNGTNYILKGEAYEAYLVMDNIASQLHMMQFDSQFVDERGYLITIEGHNLPEVDRIVKEYNISESLVNVHPTNKNWKSVSGLIFKEDLIRFVEENDADSISLGNLTVTRTGSITNGETTVTNPFTYPAGQSDRAIAEYQMFKEQETSQIVLYKSGVTRIDEKDLIKVQDERTSTIP